MLLLALPIPSPTTLICTTFLLKFIPLLTIIALYRRMVWILSCPLFKSALLSTAVPAILFSKHVLTNDSSFQVPQGTRSKYHALQKLTTHGVWFFRIGRSITMSSIIINSRLGPCLQWQLPMHLSMHHPRSSAHAHKDPRLPDRITYITAMSTAPTVCFVVQWKACR